MLLLHTTQAMIPRPSLSPLSEARQMDTLHLHSTGVLIAPENTDRSEKMLLPIFREFVKAVSYG